MGNNSSKEVVEPKKPKSTRFSEPIPVKGEDYSKPLPYEKLPKKLQEIVDDEESLWDSVYDGHGPESTDSSVRYAAYAARVRTILLSAHRYVAYTSDIGESFRPVAHPWLVRGAYGISWAYLIGDVSHEGYKAYLRQQKTLHPELQPGVPSLRATDASLGGDSVRGHIPVIEDWRTVVVQRAIFQSIASMALPAFTIHSIVRYSGKAMKDVKNARLRTWGPIGLGLAAVPALPFIFDKPVEEAVEWSFHKAFETFGSKQAVAHSTAATNESRSKRVKEKEL